MLGWSQVRASGQGSDDVVRAYREFAGGRLMFGRCYRELAESSPKVSWEVCRELAGSSPEECGKVHRKFTDRLSGAHREFTGRMLEVHWEFTEGNRELAGGSSKRCREFTEETIGE
ncbi:hypothetical protein BHE74_00004218 [Ensete ventricosum]|nr:hypothetical protein BHE74_00004218 [Ensete ventricosum]